MTANISLFDMNSFRKRTSAPFYFLLMLTVAASHCIGASQTIVDLSSETTSIGFRFQDFAQSGQIKKLNERPAFEITWDASQKPYCEISLRQKPALPEFIEAQITVDVFIPEDNRATLLTVRLQDRDDEFFQFRQDIPRNVTGWHQIAFPVSLENSPSVSWGGKSPNKKLDPPLRLAGFSVGYKDRQAIGSLGLGNVSLEAIKVAIKAKLHTGNPIHLIKPGEEGQLSIRLNNPGTQPAKVKLHYSISVADEKDGTESFEQNIILGPLGENAVKLPPPLKYGIYRINVQLADERGKYEKKELTYGYMPPAGPTPGRAKGFLFGISEHPQWYTPEEQDLMAQAAAWAGIKVIRDGIDWRRMQPTQDRWDFGSFDHFLQAFGKYDIELAPTYPGPLPTWATAADWKPAKPVNRGRPRPDYEAWGTFVRTFAERYKGRIRFVETWNEPDLLSFANFTPEEYVRLMEIAFKETKQVDPNMVVQSGGFTGFRVPDVSSSDARFLEKSVRDGKDFYDIFAFHGHGSFKHYEPQIQNLAELRASLGDKKPWWANETAISSMHVGEIGQAENLFQKFLFSWAHGAIGYNWYNLRNKGFDPKNNEHNFGLITKDFYPKPAYATYNMLARYYREGNFIDRVEIGPRMHGYLFKGKDDDYLLANWNGDFTMGAVRPIIVADITGRASIVDLWGNETQLDIANDSIVFPVSQRPSTLRITGQANKPSFIGEVFRTKGELAVIPGVKRNFALTLSNPGKQNLTFDFNFTTPTGLRFTPNRHTVTIPPKEVRDVLFDVTADASFTSKLRAPKSATLDMRISGLWQGKLDYKVRMATRISQNNFDTLPTFELNDQSQVTSLVVNEPSTAHLFWKGPDDLSAKIWMAENDGQLKIRTSVTDDIHAQPHTGESVWGGDGIQLGLNIPGQNRFWEIGLTHLSSGQAEVYIWQAPSGFSAEKTLKRIALKTQRNETTKQTIYEAEIPISSIGLDRQTAWHGFGFNLLVNDNDNGATRESFIALEPGLGRSKTTDGWPIVAFGNP